MQRKVIGYWDLFFWKSAGDQLLFLTLYVDILSLCPECPHREGQTEKFCVFDGGGSNIHDSLNHQLPLTMLVGDKMCMPFVWSKPLLL